MKVEGLGARQGHDLGACCQLVTSLTYDTPEDFARMLP